MNNFTYIKDNKEFFDGLITKSGTANKDDLNKINHIYELFNLHINLIYKSNNEYIINLIEDKDFSYLNYTSLFLSFVIGYNSGESYIINQIKESVRLNKYTSTESTLH